MPAWAQVVLRMLNAEPLMCIEEARLHRLSRLVAEFDCFLR